MKPILVRKLLIILIWVALWQLASRAIHNSILFAGPADVLRALSSLVFTPDFWRSAAGSLGRILTGFLAAFAAGIFLGSLAFVFPLIREIFAPVIAVSKSVPVASFVILALIWAGSENLSIFISFLVVFPILYVNTLSGLAAADHELLEMAQVFSLNCFQRIRFLYLPALLPYLRSGCRVALGMAWKSGVAAEVIGVPKHTIGEGLYMAKIYLATPEVFAWTFVIILLSVLTERLFLLLLRLFEAANTRLFLPARGFAAPLSNLLPFSLSLCGLTKSYGKLRVLESLNLSMDSSRIYCLMGASGCGKTTLLRLLLGLEQADAGAIHPHFSENAAGKSVPKHASTSGGSLQKLPLRFTAVFQENRLCESFTPLDNVLLAAESCYSRAQVFQELCRLLPPEAVLRPVSTLSGGMKRRTAIVRAMLAPSDAVLMDEPFTGLDEQTKANVIAYIKEKAAHRLLLVSTHQPEDVTALEGELLSLFSAAPRP